VSLILPNKTFFITKVEFVYNFVIQNILKDFKLLRQGAKQAS